MRAITRLLICVVTVPVCQAFSQFNEGGLMQHPNSESQATLEAVRRFNDAFNRHDVDGVMALMTDDCVFENTNPPPDGATYRGQNEVRAVWQKFFAANPDALFEFEEVFASGNRCVVRWIYRKTKEGKPWHLRGVDIFEVRDGKIAGKRSYVKG